MKYFKHETAVIDDNVTIDDGVKIWHYSHICKDAIIGKNVNLGQNVFVGNKVLIGNNCKIQNNVSVYDGVTLEEDVFCGPSVVFTNVHNPRSFIERKTEYKNTLIKKGSTLGANCTIICGITVGEYAFIGAGTVVTKDVKPFALIVGVPGKQIGWMSMYGNKLNLPLSGNSFDECKVTGKKYQLKNSEVSVIA